MKLRMQLDDQFIGILRGKLDLKGATDIVKEGLTILNWAVQETEKNRVILSADQDGQDAARLSMPVLERLARIMDEPRRRSTKF
jgi:hypothetical protein